MEGRVLDCCDADQDAPPVTTSSLYSYRADSDTAKSDPDLRHHDEQERKMEEKSGLCIGSIFGLDVGGTLAKLVYFEQDNKSTTSNSGPKQRKQSHDSEGTLTNVVFDETVEHPHSRDDEDCPFGTIGGVEMEEPKSLDDVTMSHERHRSLQSKEALRNLSRARQSSMPDNLAEFATQCGFATSLLFSQNSMRGGTLSSDNCTDGRSTAMLSTPPTNALPKLPPIMHAEGGMRRCRSMFNISQSAEHAEALDCFYNFVRRLDSYKTEIKDTNLSFYSRALGGEFHFIRFETRHMSSAMDLIRVNNLHLNIVEMGATGGGAHKYAKDWERVLGIQIMKQEELDSLVAGMQFVLLDVVGECYTFKPRDNKDEAKNRGSPTEFVRELTPISSVLSSDTGKTEQEESFSSFGTSNKIDKGEQASEYTFTNGSSTHENIRTTDDSHDRNKPSMKSSSKRKGSTSDEWWWSRKVKRDVATDSQSYPYLLVTIGTGVSVLRVDGPRRHERISGSTIGGGTYWGLCRLLTRSEDFDSALNLAERGDASKVDMMVGDIYGNDSDALEKLGLPANIVASSFGKLVAKQEPAADLNEEDLARALLLMVTNNIGQVAYLNAQLHNTKRIYFVGNFLRHNVISQQRLAYAINYWSQGKMEALFLEHEGYFGALGAFLLSQGISHGDGGVYVHRGSKKEFILSSKRKGVHNRSRSTSH